MYKILVIDDDKAICSLMKEAFNSEPDYQVFEAESAIIGLLSIIKYSPNVIILGVNLNDVISGMDILNAVQQNPLLNNIHIFVMTGSEYLEISKSITLGADDYFIKPFDPVLVVSVIKNKLHN